MQSFVAQFRRSGAWHAGVLAAVLVVPQVAAGQEQPPAPLERLPPVEAPPDDAGVDEAPLQNQPPDDPRDEDVRLRARQIEILEEMNGLLAERLAAQEEALQAHARLAAQRDRELAAGIDDLSEGLDARDRSGPALPSTLREHFPPTRTNESPLGLWGTLAGDLVDFEDSNATFTGHVVSLHAYLLLDERFLLQANPEFRANRVELESAELDWFLHDNLTLVAGRFYSPLGFFNERLHTSWIFKTPDRPLLFWQVLPSPLSFNGVALRGAAYLGSRPVKLEYAGLLANGLSLEAAAPGPVDFADLRRMDDELADVNNDKLVGGRVGLAFPEAGLVLGVSGLANGAYDRAGEHDLSAWDVDVGWHRGNWDLRFEYAQTDQQVPGAPIDRRGFYAQAAWRPYDSLHPFWQKLEAVVRFDHVEFDGIDLDATGTAFGARERIPVDRNRYTVGLNFYPYPSLVFKAAYEVNDELHFAERDDNGFAAQAAWGF